MTLDFKDVDDFLRNSENPKSAFSDIIDRVTQDQDNSAECGLDPAHYQFESFEILGELSTGAVAMFSRVNRKIYITHLKDLTLDRLAQIGGDEVLQRVSRKDQEGKLVFETLKRHLIVNASQHQLPDSQWLGQGIHLLQDGRLVIVNGGAASLWDGVTFTDHTRPLIEDTFIDFDSGRDWIDFDALSKRVLAMDAGKADEIMRGLLNIFAGWGFQGTHDHYLVCGWWLAQIIQASWDWRPHLWLSGAQESGKSLLIRLLKSLGGKLALSFEGKILTEPGLRQGIKNDSVLISIDEFERTEQRERILDLLRSAGRGGMGAKGTASQQVVLSRIRHMVFVGSIETGLTRAAENSRFLQIETKKDSEKRNPQFPDASQMPCLRLDSFALAIWASTRAKALIEKTNYVKGHDRRFIESLAVCFSMIAVCSPNPFNELNLLMEGYLEDWIGAQDGALQEDERQLREDILMAKVRVCLTEINKETGFESPRYVDRTVSQILQNLTDEMDQTLQANGIKKRSDGLFLHPDIVRRTLLKDTVWHDLNIRNILLRLPGARGDRSCLARTQLRGVVIPLDDEIEGCVLEEAVL